MKKLISGTFIVLFLAAGLTSCKKDWTCECTTKTEGYSSTSSVTMSGPKKFVKSSCEDQNTSTTSEGSTISSTCTLK